MPKIKLGSKEYNLSKGAIAGVAVAGVAILIAVAVVLWYELDGKYLNYGSTVRFRIDPSNGAGPLYIIVQQTGTVTLTDTRDEATKFRVQTGGSSGPLTWTKAGEDAKSYFTLYDPKTQLYLNSGAVHAEYAYLSGHTEDGLQFNLSSTSSKVAVGSRILPGSYCNVITPHGPNGTNQSTWQYDSQMNNGNAGIIICMSFSCPDTVWVIEQA